LYYKNCWQSVMDWINCGSIYEDTDVTYSFWWLQYIKWTAVKRCVQPLTPAGNSEHIHEIQTTAKLFSLSWP
jgi:hypothetical protein